MPTTNTNRPDRHQQVLALRRTHSIAETARLSGLPLGTVKTICHRAGAVNTQHRALFILPLIQPSDCTALAVPELPPQTVTTGDKEVDALLWLRECIKTGEPALIAKALEARQRITTPAKELELRYAKHLVSQNPGNTMAAAFGSFGFADLESLAKGVTDRRTRQHEANQRFNGDPFALTPAEQFCQEALTGLKPKGQFGYLAPAQVDKRFAKHPALMPSTLTDCLHERAYWLDLYRLRAAFPDCGDPLPEVQAREDWVFRSMATIRPRSKAEAVQVLRYMVQSDAMDRAETESILLNLIGSG